MNRELVEKVEKAIGVIALIYKASYEGERSSGFKKGDELWEFEALADEIYALAAECNLEQHLPGSEPTDLPIGAVSTVCYRTLLNLPGFWDGLYFVLYPTPSWIKKLRLVSRLAGKRSNPHDDNWPIQSDIATSLNVSKTTVKRWIDKEILKTNGKSGNDCRIDPVSILRVCKDKKLCYDPAGIDDHDEAGHERRKQEIDDSRVTPK